MCFIEIWPETKKLERKITLITKRYSQPRKEFKCHQRNCRFEGNVTKVYFSSSSRKSAPICTKYTSFFSSLHWEGCERDKYATSYNFAREFLYISFGAITHSARTPLAGPIELNPPVDLSLVGMYKNSRAKL